MSDDRPVVARPLHNRDGTIRSLARQMLADLDLGRIGALARQILVELDRPVPSADFHAMARQILDGLDRRSLNTPVPTLTLQMLLERLCEALDTSAQAEASPAVHNMFEQRSKLLAAPESNPNLAYWRQAAERDEEALGPDEPAEC